MREREPIRDLITPSGVQEQSPWGSHGAKPPEAENVLAFRIPLIKLYSKLLLHAMPLITDLSEKIKILPTHRMTASTRFENCTKYCVWTLIELPSEARGSRSNCSACYARRIHVDIKFIEPEVLHGGRGTIVGPHTAKQKSKICPRVTPPDLPLQGSWGNRRRGKRTWRKDRWCNEQGNGSEMKYLSFQRLFFLQHTKTVIIVAPAGKLRRFRGGFGSIPSYTFCRNM